VWKALARVQGHRVEKSDANLLRGMKINRYLLKLALENAALGNMERETLILMARVALGNVSSDMLAAHIPKRFSKDFIAHVAPSLSKPPGQKRNRALAITFYMLGIAPALAAEILPYTAPTLSDFIREYERGERVVLPAPRQKPRKRDQIVLKEKVFATLHTPPSTYGINRTTWTIKLLCQVLQNEGVSIGKNTISAIIRADGYIFRKTREVLTSNDPNYRQKLLRITNILRRLGPADRFFSIDEYGPVSIRERGGRRRVRRGERPLVPQFQESKGHLIITAALELSTNQITHFYSLTKDTGEMIRLLNVLREKYWDCRCLYLSWDAASWHSSRLFRAEVKRLNQREFRAQNQSPTIKIVPLPARAQFLNVIESVFSGLSQAIFHNSNYASIDTAKEAVDRYIAERNEYFRMNPKRAGNKIWGKEQTPSYFSVSHNCKNPAFSRLASVGHRRSAKAAKAI
jgi:transposase